jgi:hypothetical protein
MWGDQVTGGGPNGADGQHQSDAGRPGMMLLQQHDEHQDRTGKREFKAHIQDREKPQGWPPPEPLHSGADVTMKGLCFSLLASCNGAWIVRSECGDGIRNGGDREGNGAAEPIQHAADRWTNNVGRAPGGFELGKGRRKLLRRHEDR